jgi:ribosomal protein L20A (L18A)
LTEVKTFRITGHVKKPRTAIPFSLEIKATKDRDALETMYADLGSRHKARRLEIKVEKIEEMKASQAEAAKSGR